MAEDLFKKISDLINSKITPIKDLLEITKHKVDQLSMIQGVTSDNVRFLKEQQSVMNQKLDEHSKVLSEHTDKIDALMLEAHELNRSVKDQWDKIDLGDETNKRDIDQIKEHLGLTT